MGILYKSRLKTSFAYGFCVKGTSRLVSHKDSISKTRCARGPPPPTILGTTFSDESRLQQTTTCSSVMGRTPSVQVCAFRDCGLPAVRSGLWFSSCVFGTVVFQLCVRGRGCLLGAFWGSGQAGSRFFWRRPMAPKINYPGSPGRSRDPQAGPA